MKVNAVIFDLDGTLTKPVLDFDKIRSEMGLSPESAVVAMPFIDERQTLLDKFQGLNSRSHIQS